MKLRFIIALMALAIVVLVGMSWVIKVLISPYEPLSAYQLDPNREQDIAEFDRYYSRWKSKNIKNYRLVQEGDCWTCQSPQELEVADGKSLGAFLILDNGKKGKHDQSHLGSIDELFEEIRLAIEAKADGIQVEYEPALGYPLRASINYKNEVADDECLHHIRELKVLR